MTEKKEMLKDPTEFNEMSVRELEELQNKLKEALDSVKNKRLAEVKTEIEDILAREGFTFEEVFGFGKHGKRFPNNPPKYRNPDNPEQSWSGKGKRPNWLAEKIKAGADKEDFRIA